MLSSTLETLADFADIRGSIADGDDLRRAASALARLTPAESAALERRAGRDRLANEPGISAGVQARLHEVALGGYDLAIMAARSSLPLLHRRLLELGVLTSREALSLVQQLGIVTLADLQLALDDGRLKQVADKGLDERLRPAAAALDIEGRRLTLGRAADITERCSRRWRAAVPRSICSPPPATSAASNRWSSAIVDRRPCHPTRRRRSTRSARCRAWTMCCTRGARRAICRHAAGEVDVRVAAPDEYGTVLFNATGSRAHLRAMHAGGISDRGSRPARKRCMPRRGCPSSRRSSAKAPAKSKPRRPARCRVSSSASTFAATCTCTPSTATGRHARGDGGGMLRRSATSTSRSPITRSAPPRPGRFREATSTRQRDEIAAVRERYPQHRRSCTASRSTSCPTAGSISTTPSSSARHRPRVAARFGAGTTAKRLTRALHPGDPASARHDHHASGQPARRPPRRAIRWISTRSTPPRPRPAPRSRSTARPSHLDLDGEHARARDRRRRDADDRQRLPPRPLARPADAPSASGRPGAAGSSRTRAQHPAARRSPRVHRGQASQVALAPPGSALALRTASRLVR